MNNRILIGFLVVAFGVGVFSFVRKQNVVIINSSLSNTPVSAESFVTANDATVSSPDFFVSEQAELNAEMKSLQTDMSQLDAQNYDDDMKQLEQVK